MPKSLQPSPSIIFLFRVTKFCHNPRRTKKGGDGEIAAAVQAKADGKVRRDSWIAVQSILLERQKAEGTRVVVEH